MFGEHPTDESNPHPDEASVEPLPNYRHEDTRSSPEHYSVQQAQLRWELSLRDVPLEDKQDFHRMLTEFMKGQPPTEQDRQRHHVWGYQETMGRVRLKEYRRRPAVQKLGEIPGSFGEARSLLQARLERLRIRLPRDPRAIKSQPDWESLLGQQYRHLLNEIKLLTSIDEYVLYGRAIEYFIASLEGGHD